jgi:pyruvate-formate lyase-activating enzyme
LNLLGDTVGGHDRTRWEEYWEAVDLEVIDLKAVNLEAVNQGAVNLGAVY